MQFTRYGTRSDRGRARGFPARTAIFVISACGFFWNAHNFYQSNEEWMIARDLGIRKPKDVSPTLPPPPTATKPKRSFLEVAKAARTDKVEGHQNLRKCVKRGRVCIYPEAENKKCRPWGHFYDTIYDRWLTPYLDQPMQFLEIGFFEGNGFEAYSNYFHGGTEAAAVTATNNHHQNTAELHSMEITCQQGSDKNHAKEHPNYQSLLESSRLHCGDASNYDFLHDTWIHKMKRNGEGPPLMVVVDDGSHLAEHMAASLFFWFPRIEPGGIMVVEDIQPIATANQFRTHIVPQITKDLHWCGGPQTTLADNDSNNDNKDSLCFPTIQPFLQGVHCEMHICVFQRNDKASVEPSRADSLTPIDAFSGAQKCLFGP